MLIIIQDSEFHSKKKSQILLHLNELRIMIKKKLQLPYLLNWGIAISSRAVKSIFPNLIPILRPHFCVIKNVVTK